MISRPIQKILVRAPNWIGDAVMATPSLTALRRFHESAEIVLLAKPTIAALFEQHPDIDRVMTYEDLGRHSGLSGLWRLSRELKHEQFDMAFLLQNALEAALLAFFAGIPNRVGYATDGRKFLLTRSIRKKNPAPHRSDAYLALMGLVDAEGDSISAEEKRPPYLVVSSQERQTARDFLKSLGVPVKEGPLIGFNPGAAYGTAKRWLPQYFAALADQLIEEKQATILIFGARSEIEVAETILKQMKHPAFVLSGKTTVRQLMACIKTCHLFISNDSGPMHIASALSVPQIALFGPTNAAATFSAGPFDLMVQNKVDCAPCRHRHCPIDHPCMTGLSVETVFTAAAQQLSQTHKKQVAVFLDRDGTINPDTGYIDNIDRFTLFPGTAAAIARLNKKGIPVILVTNQSGVARGFFPESFVGHLHLYLQRLLAKKGAYLDGIYTCVHHPDFAACNCRKPAGGMIRQALLDHSIDFSGSYVVGDKSSDLELAKALAPEEIATSILVKTGEGIQTLKKLESLGKSPDAVAENLSDAIDWILK
ncbi:MAG: lipopolysaccharide heptosyltransferase II [Nitrospirota bacterium]|nr:lipopolysaccharide heptosyltransferase II [Nitrospirota bacterium]